MRRVNRSRQFLIKGIHSAALVWAHEKWWMWYRSSNTSSCLTSTSVQSLCDCLKVAFRQGYWPLETVSCQFVQFFPLKYHLFISFEEQHVGIITGGDLRFWWCLSQSPKGPASLLVTKVKALCKCFCAFNIMLRTQMSLLQQHLFCLLPMFCMWKPGSDCSAYSLRAGTALR